MQLFNDVSIFFSANHVQFAQSDISNELSKIVYKLVNKVSLSQFPEF